MPGVRAGLECRVDDPDAPTVVKDMTLGFRMRQILEAGEVAIAHVLIPTRRLEVAVASRVRAADYGRLPFRRGALTGTLHATEQEQVLVRMQDEIVGALERVRRSVHRCWSSRGSRPTRPMRTEKLAAVAPGATVDDVQSALDRCVRPELIHEDAAFDHRSGGACEPPRRGCDWFAIPSRTFAAGSTLKLRRRAFAPPTCGCTRA